MFLAASTDASKPLCANTVTALLHVPASWLLLALCAPQGVLQTSCAPPYESPRAFKAIHQDAATGR